MAVNQEKINQIVRALNKLNRQQHVFKEEIKNLREELDYLKNKGVDISSKSNDFKTSKDFISEGEIIEGFEEKNFENIEEKSQEKSVKKVESTLVFEEEKEEEIKESPVRESRIKKSDLERFIGENLLSKIGIGITVIGVAIGVKYSIEHNLISPLTRIVLGYLVGLGLLGVGMKLKKKYESFSAVLVSGAMAILYFVTYFAYSIYGFYSQGITFALMTIFTGFTVFAAINYNKQIIAHIGLVGAYAVPFFLSNGSGKVAILFSYMVLINIGILIISFKKLWKPLYYVSFVATWTIYFSWYIFQYEEISHFGIALTFLSIFFVLFYLTFLAYQFIKNEKFELDNILLLLFNSTVFYGIGYSILAYHENGQYYLGIFTLFNAVIHFVVTVMIYKKKLADKKIFYFVSGLVLVFLTITIPVQLDGNYVTMLWAVEAAILFWVGRTKKVAMFEQFSLPLMIVAFLSIVIDWNLMDNYNLAGYGERENITPIFNGNFMTSFIVIASFVFMAYLSRSKKYITLIKNESFISVIKFLIPAFLLVITYFAFRLEIVNYWENIIDSYNYSFTYDFKCIWNLNYTLFFVTILSFVNIKYFKNTRLFYVSLALSTYVLVWFLTVGLFDLSSLRENYLYPFLIKYGQGGIFNILIRYISFGFLGVFLVVFYRHIRQNFVKKDFKKIFEIGLHVTILWLLSSELFHWLDFAGSDNSYKLGLSILWGIYSLFLVTYGLIKEKQILRIMGISLFGITLVKLFLYDIAHLNTLRKTIIFISLGILLLIMSFLYNKFNKQLNSTQNED